MNKVFSAIRHFANERIGTTTQGELWQICALAMILAVLAWFCQEANEVVLCYLLKFSSGFMSGVALYRLCTCPADDQEISDK